MNQIVFQEKVDRGFGWLFDMLCTLRLFSKRDLHYSERGHRMAIYANDAVGISINQFGVFEGEQLRLLMGFLGPVMPQIRGDIALDVGANIGNHSIFFSDYFKVVIAFEANPLTYQLLAYNIGFRKNIVGHCVGLGDEKGTFQLTEKPTNFGGSSISIEGNDNEHSVDVAVDRLDDFLRVDGHISLMKIDVEGFEENVVRGAIETIRKYEPIIVFEQHEREFDNGMTPTARLLKDLGYEFCWSETKSTSRSYLVRRAFNVWGLMFGKRVKIRYGSPIPKKFHAMLIGVPPRHFEVLILDHS